MSFERTVFSLLRYLLIAVPAAVFIVRYIKTDRELHKKQLEFSLNHRHGHVYGGAGHGKTFGYVKPEMMQLYSDIIGNSR